jgi:protocatechuate 3,4-dioxygenase beta subunit
MQSDRNVLLEKIAISDRSEPLQVKVRRGPAKLSGTVTDSQGRRVPHALIVLTPESPLSETRLRDLNRSFRADQNGAFQLEGILPGPYRVSSGSSSRGVSVSLGEGRTVSVDLTFLD